VTTVRGTGIWTSASMSGDPGESSEVAAELEELDAGAGVPARSSPS